MPHPTGSEAPPTGRWRLLPWGASALLLLLPILAMTVTDEVDWGPEDVLALGLLLMLACTAFDLALRRTRRTRGRLLAALAILAALIYAWAELAVGLLTDLGS